MPEPLIIDNGDLADYSALVDDVTDGVLGTGAKQLVGIMSAVVGETNKASVSAAGALKVDGSAVTQPVSGTVTATLGALPAGTNNIGDVDVLTVPAPLSTTGGGTEAAALRVTLANDSTGVVSVDDNGGSLTVDGTVSVSGAVDTELTTADVDTGAGTDTRAVVGLVKAASGGGVLVSDTNPLPVSDAGGSLTVDGSVSITGSIPAGTNNIGDVDVLTLPALVAGTANIGDVDVLTVPAPLSTTGGGTEATALRVTVASDSTGVLSVDDNGGSITVDGTVTVTDGLNVEGDIAHDAVDSGNPVKVGAKAVAFGANPTAVAAADRTDLYASRAGIPFVLGGHPNVVTLEAAYTAAQTDTAIVTVAGGLKIVVTEIEAVLDEATTVGVGFRVGFAAATTPTTTGVVLTHPGLVPGGGITRGSGAGILGAGADGEDLRITSEVPTSGSLRVLVSYFTIES